jgi:hypothetical protein
MRIALLILCLITVGGCADQNSDVQMSKARHNRRQVSCRA